MARKHEWQRAAFLACALFSTSCNDDAAAGCGEMCEVYGPHYPGVGACKDGACTPTFSECVDRDNFSTCAEACAALGSVCAENQCAGYTYLIYGGPPLCEDPERKGGGIVHGCDEPIDWQFNTSARCCCEQG